ncbi:hypothetical protein [Mammaliicoccus sciuri]|uniref:hypothetical protein n=1 Tax=Mammaliicoccus sciuri TaxID=1296 RepID=UPI000878912B|nr:hypothetical protein [Mammaliicoccus sciuri]
MDKTIIIQIITVIGTISGTLLAGVFTIFSRNRENKLEIYAQRYENFYFELIEILYEFNPNAVKWSVFVGSFSEDKLKNLLYEKLKYLSPELANLRYQYIPLSNKMYSHSGYEPGSFDYRKASKDIQKASDEIDDLFIEIIQLALKDSLLLELKLKRPLLSLTLLRNIYPQLVQPTHRMLRLLGLYSTAKLLLAKRNNH